MTSADWANAVASFLAVLVALISLGTSLRRARQDKTDADIAAVVKQVQALEVDIAGNYMKRDQVDSALSRLGEELKVSIRDLSRQVEDLNKFLRRQSV